MTLIFRDSNDLADGNDFTIDAADEPGAGLEIHTIAHSGAADVYLESDPNGDGTFEVSVKIDSLSGEGVSQGNEIEVSSGVGPRLRINNTSGGTADYIVTAKPI